MTKKIRLSTRELLIALFGVLGLGGGLLVSASAPATAAVTNQCNTQDDELNEKCACEAALKENTIEALEEFLRKYPPGRKASACSALALNALSQFGGDESSDGPDEPGGGGYGN